MNPFRTNKYLVVSLLLLAFIVSIPVWAAEGLSPRGRNQTSGASVEPAPEAPAPPLPDVAVLGAENDPSWISDVEAKLNATGQFNSVTGINVLSVTPTLAALQAFDAVLVWSDTPYADPVALGNNLADFHDAGGGVVTAIFERHSVKLQGRWEAETYNVFDGGSIATGNQTLGTVHDSAHPVMAGVSAFDGGSSSYRPPNTNLTAGAILIAEWSDGKSLVAVKECHNGYPRVDLGFFPPSSDARADLWQSATDGALLMANALSYVANPPDADGDGIPDACDTPSVHNLTQVTDFFRIQEALDVAVDGDEIAADPGTYHENINFNGRAVTLRSTSGNPADTIIDGAGHIHVVQCSSGEGPDTVLEGFTITGGNANSGSFPNNVGSGMFNSSTNPTVKNCNFNNNSAAYGGGMYNYVSSPSVTNCSFSGNLCTAWGSGMYNHNNSNPTVTNCNFTGNTATNGGGGGMNNADSSPIVTNCSFTGNSALSGAGMHNQNSSPVVTNCIFWADSPDEIQAFTSTPTVNFSNIQGGWAGAGGGNINADPFFVDADGLDNTVGTDDDNLRLQANSPCIDAADSTPLVSRNIFTDLDGKPRLLDYNVKIDTGIGPVSYADMGVYEFLANCIIPGDINCDGVVDMLDLILLYSDWLTTTE